MKIKILSIVLAIILILSTASYATVTNPITDPDHYKPADNTQSTKLVEIGRVIVASIRNVGVVIAVVSLMVIGFKYMFAGTQEKASYKETMIPYIIGLG